MNKMKNLTMLLALLFSTVSMAQLTKPDDGSSRGGPGCSGGIAIPDDTYDGTIGSMICMSIAGPGGVLTDLNLDLAVDHSWAGDLAVKIVAPDTTILTVMNRPGFAEAADDGTGGFGDSSDLTSTAILNFINGAAVSAEDMGAGIDGTQFICQDDGICTYAPNAGLGEGTDFSDFVGTESTGTWQVCVGDAGGGDNGFLCPATALNFTAGSATTVVSPANGSTVGFGAGNANGAATVTITNDATATSDLTNIVCGFAGGDAANFTVVTAMPAGPLAPGASVVVQMTATAGIGEQLSSTLTCTYDGDPANGSSSWPVQITGVARIIPSLNMYGILALMAMFLFGAMLIRRKFV
jgi:subtilisin-like proprotein convertase family protein